MAGNKAVVYQGTGKVEVRGIDYPTYEMKDGPGVNKANIGRKTPHGAILKNVATNICGSDQHMVRGRTTAPEGLVLGHEITGEVVDTGPDVEFIKVGDLCSVPFNISCGRCRNCKERKTGVCLNVNPDRPGSAYGYVDMGGWIGGQAEYVMVPYADWNLLRFPDKDQAMEKILDLAMLSDIFPTGYHGCVSAGVTTGSTVMKYNRELMMAILHDRVQIAKNVNATPIPLDQAPQGYREFDQGAARKYVLDPHGVLSGRTT
jgi:glutathione-independent formaldehyde dehydrogenase